MTDWQPINTAPRSETDAVFVWNGEEVIAATCHDGTWWTCMYEIDRMKPQPTLWLPLPTPPTQEPG